jgi:hypothetical protein
MTGSRILFSISGVVTRWATGVAVLSCLWVCNVSAQGITATAAEVPKCILTSNPKVIPAGGSSVLTVTCTPQAERYEWSGVDVSTQEASVIVHPAGPTNYTVKGVNSFGSGAIASSAVYVCNSPPPTIYPGQNLVAANSSALFTGSIGNDVFLGIGGVNQVNYRCNAQDFTLTKTASGWKIVSAAEGIDELNHIERVAFADKTVALDIGGNAGMAYRLYRAAFNRAPDTDGLRYWIAALDQGMPLQTVAASFIESAEFKKLHSGNPSDVDYVALLYRNVLHRLPDDGGASYWAGLLQSGSLDRSALLVQFSESSENQAQVLALIINGIDLGSSASSVARRWIEVALAAIRNDNARPPVHARNLFHLSAAMWDAWATGDAVATPFLFGALGKGDVCPAVAVSAFQTGQVGRQEAISYAAYRLIMHRYARSPGFAKTEELARALMTELGYDTAITTTNLALGSPAELGNYIGQCYIIFGLQDGSNESGNYANKAYKPVNIALIPSLPGDPFISNLDRWQPLDLVSFEDQAGFGISGGGTVFVGAEWGQVIPFAMTPEQRTVFQRQGADYPVYYDPGPPASIYADSRSAYQRSFAMVAKWSSHLDPRDGVMVDISPGAIGNLGAIPEGFAGQMAMYNERQGGDVSTGRRINPVTQLPYAAQIVPRGDYARVLAEFWADGPNSETPPGHWYVLLNRVTDAPGFRRKYQGVGAEMTPLEWDVKSYFTLGGAMHDAAIAAWGIKGWYDTVRPISAIRAMGELGQSSNPNLPHYDPKGLPLEQGLIELVMPGDPLADFGINKNYHLYKVKLKSWKGPREVQNSKEGMAGVDWILAENWWPYQAATFVTPPFAGYVSGHSTYSRAGAEVLTALTGSAFFPGGMGYFHFSKDIALKLEKGPSVDMDLQWATYQDAADQCSLSRIWGGIHPTIDDMPGRLIGARIGQGAFALANRHFGSINLQ